ncbi:hypothetical protein C0992_009411 [Termitomyces sp. T32_za158]|nr:hypothetical protein C0992_009411 [Termitomyces sp. T32_za158]
MNFHSNFSIVRTLLTTQADEPTLATVKKILTDQEDTRTVLNPDAVEEVQAMYGRTKKGRSSQADSDDEGPLRYDWLNSQGKDACHCCGLPGHRSSRCIADMPKKIKDKVIHAAKEHHHHHRKCSSSTSDSDTAAAKFTHVASDSDSSDSDDDKPIQAMSARDFTCILTHATTEHEHRQQLGMNKTKWQDLKTHLNA